MPHIDDIVQTTKKPFKKKPYRPWDLFDELPPKKDIKNDEKTVEIPPLITKKVSKPHIDVKKSLNKKVSISKPLDSVSANNTETTTKTNSYLIDNQYETVMSVKKTNSNQLDSRLVNALVNNSDYSHIKKRGITEEISRLTGHQKKLLFFIVENCASKGLLTTGQITNETLRSLLNTDQNTVKTSVHRLILKGLVKREEGKRGNGGFTCYTIPEEVRYIVNQERNMISNQLDNVLVNNRITDRLTNPSSSSSFNELKTTTTEEFKNNANEDWLKNIDIEPLSHIGFSTHHLKQISAQNNLTPDLVQKSIYAFAFDLIQNGKNQKINEPISYFMSILKRGMPYAPPQNYESPEARAMRLFVENQEKMRAEQEKNEKKAFDFTFDDWIGSLDESEKSRIFALQEEKNQWLQCLKFFQNEHEKHDFDTFIRPLHPVNENGKWIIFCPNQFLKEDIHKRFHRIFEKFLGNYVIEVGNNSRVDHDSAFPTEVRELRKYFRETLWEDKRNEIFGKK